MVLEAPIARNWGAMYNLRGEERTADGDMQKSKVAELAEEVVLEASASEQLRFARGLAACSQVLLHPAGSEADKARILGDALEKVRWATRTSRAFLYENFDDPERGLCSRGVAVAHDERFPPETTVPWLVQKIPWALAPDQARSALENGQPYGGTVESAFATKPDFQQTLRADGVLSVQFFPIHLGGEWWGYVGFDDRERERAWREAEIVLLRTAADLFANALARWQNEAALAQRSRYEEGLSHCSRVLLRVAQSEAEQDALLTEALESLRLAVRGGRAYLIENFRDAELGPSLRIKAESCRGDVPPHIDNPANQRIAWSDMPLEMRQTLAAGNPFGGPVDQALAKSPEWVAIFKGQAPPLESMQTFPICFGDYWWGFVGFDDVDGPREWSAEEVRILRVAAEMIGNTLQRWGTESALRGELEERRRREERLRLLESAVVNTSEGVIITAAGPVDPPGPRILYVNEAFCRSSGYEPEEAIGGSLWLLRGPRTSHEELERLRSALALPEAVEVELLSYRRDGSSYWAELAVTPVVDAEGTCTHFVAVQRDVTERIRAEAAIRAAKEELEARVASRTSEILQANAQLHKEIVNRRRAEAEVKQRLAIEQSLAAISSRLVEGADARTFLPELLQEVAAMVGSRRVALIFLEEGGSEVGELYDWCSADTAPLERDYLTEILPTFAPMLKPLEGNQSVFFEDINRTLAPGSGEREILNEMGTQSVAMFPLHVDGRLAAVLISSNFVKENGELKQQLDVLHVVSRLLGSALQREALLNSLEQRAIDRSRELAAFYDMTMLASMAENLSGLLEPALSQIMEAVRCEAVSVHELSEEGNGLRLVAHLGLGPQEDAQVATVPERVRAWFDQLNEPIIANDTEGETWLPAALRPEGFAVYIGAQLRARGRALGLLSCYRREVRPYSLNSTALVVALAEQLGIIVENYRLRQQAEQGAIIAERQRLARDLHDAVTQSLYGATLFARVGRDAMEAGDLDKTAEAMQEVEENALRAAKEMRLLLHQLQPLALEQGGLEQALERRFNQVERRLGIEAAVAIDSGLKLRPRAKEAIYRIVIEALNNSLKHAGAERVAVSLQREGGGFLLLEVSDDGRGFEVKAPRLGMGIRNMEERAGMLRGELTVKSAPGQGTTIVVRLPDEWLE